MESRDESDQQLNTCQIMSDGVNNNQPAAIGLTLPMQINQQMMASSGSAAATAVGLTSQVQLLPAVSNSGSVSMPWMVPSYPMMVLQQGIPQSLFGPNVLALQDGHVMLAPIDDSNANHQMVTDHSAAQLGANAQQNKLSKLQDQWLVNVPSSSTTKTHSTKGMAESCNLRSVPMNAVGGAQQIRNGSTPISPNRGGQSQTLATKTEVPPQPKKPLTPYMLFSKSIWPHVKAANSHLSSVCEIGAIIGSLWRDMDPKEKQRYNDLFAKDKERYENELRAYLKLTGLHASSLVKQPKPKRNREKPPTTWQSFSPSGVQQGVTTMAGSTTGTAVGQDGAEVLPTFSQAWTGQATLQLTAQQVLTQLGLGAGQTLFANSDGSISVGSSGGGISGLQSQSLQLVSVTGEPVMTIYSDPGQSGMSQLGAVTASSAGPMDGTRSSWVWQQPSSTSVGPNQEGADGGGGAGGMVLYHLPTSTGDVAGKIAELKDQLGSNNQMDLSSRPVIPTMDHLQQYAVDQLGQLVTEASADPSSREAQLEAELRQMGCALMEKAQEVSELTCKLKEAYEIIEKYKQLSGDTGNAIKTESVDMDSTPAEGDDAGNGVEETGKTAEVADDDN